MLSFHQNVVDDNVFKSFNLKKYYLYLSTFAPSFYVDKIVLPYLIGFIQDNIQMRRVYSNWRSWLPAEQQCVTLSSNMLYTLYSEHWG